jgi:maltose alpha-D-glucosyltransferase/alpha-amylase
MGNAPSDQSVPVIRLSGGWDTLLQGDARAALEQSVLPQFLPRQRWFGSKARQIQAIRLVEQATLRVQPTPAYLLLAQVEFADGASDLYFLPLAIATGSSPQVLARLVGTLGTAHLLDAIADADVCRTLLSVIAEGRTIPTDHACIRATATSVLSQMRDSTHEVLPVTIRPATSSNSLVFYGNRLLLKLFRRLETGINPDYEIGRFLTERSNFGRTPKMAGVLEYCRPNDEVVTLALLQEYIPGVVDGWQHALNALDKFYQCVSLFDEELPDKDSPLILTGSWRREARLLGRRTAEMHLALAGDSHDPAFAPEPLTAADLTSASEEVQRHAEEALQALRPHAADLSEAPLLIDAIRSLVRLDGTLTDVTGAMKIRCHGDYHLGQVMIADDVIILDFEGEPTRTIAQRRVKQSPLRDVAGMLRSFDYAAHAGLFTFTKQHHTDPALIEPLARLWQCWTCTAFLREYLTTAAGAAFLPATKEQTQKLLRLFMLGKACYELVYELNNRPDWVRIPLRGLLGLMQTRKRE